MKSLPKGVGLLTVQKYSILGGTADCACMVGRALTDLVGFAGLRLMILAIGNTILLPGFEKIKKIQKSVHKNKQTGTRKSAF